MTELNPHHVELNSGHEKVAGIVGCRVFWIDVVEADGGRLGVWWGHNYDDAIRTAEETRTDWELAEPVRDLVVGGCG